MKTEKLYAGGLAELVERPSEITGEYLAKWLTTRVAFGEAYKRLGWPYVESEQPLVVRRDGELLLDLVAEEETIYGRTVLEYGESEDVHTLPRMRLSVGKAWWLGNWLGTGKILWTQSRWAADPASVVTWLQQQVEGMSAPAETREQLDWQLGHEVWPRLIVVSSVGEYFEALWRASVRVDQVGVVEQEIAREVRERDWFLDSVLDEERVRTGEWTLEEFLAEYGTRADQDYELTCPRWREIPGEIEARIQRGSEVLGTATTRVGIEELNLPSKVRRWIATSVELAWWRLEVKRQMLDYIGALREQLLVAEPERMQVMNQKKTQDRPVSETRAGQGRPVSAGVVQGKLRYINDNNAQIPAGTIGLFPNASPEYAVAFPQCAGLIFQRGGQTSHGAIVARELGIPALIDPRAQIPDGTEIWLDGTSGRWEWV